MHNHETFLGFQDCSVVESPPLPIDYRCVNGNKMTFSYHRLAIDSVIPKNAFINPQKALVHPQTQKSNFSA